jgi:hypothetical protein
LFLAMDWVKAMLPAPSSKSEDRNRNVQGADRPPPRGKKNAHWGRYPFFMPWVHFAPPAPPTRLLSLSLLPLAGLQSPQAHLKTPLVSCTPAAQQPS